MALARRQRQSTSINTLSIPTMFVSYVLLFAWSFVVLFPLYWLAITSLKTPLDVNDGPFYIPFRDFHPTLESWRYIFVDLAEDTFSRDQELRYEGGAGADEGRVTEEEQSEGDDEKPGEGPEEGVPRAWGAPRAPKSGHGPYLTRQTLVCL